MAEEIAAAALEEHWYKAVPPGSLAERLLVRARDRIYADLVRLTGASARDRLIDIGVSEEINAGANFLERKYPHRHNITAAGLAPGAAFKAAFPEVAYRQITPGADLPFADGAFDIATSNAVLEHVGGIAEQQHFIAEHARIARRAFISMPNRLFPVEHHTGLPLVHWSEATFQAACRLSGNRKWADPSELTLMSARRLRALARAVLGPSALSGRSWRIGMTGLRLGPFSSNLYLLIGPR